MIKKVHKLFINYEKEEKWLNEMAAKGYNFINYTIGTYTFEGGTPGEYIYRIELLKEMPSNPESEAYIKFMEESGIKCIDTSWRWVFFQKKASDGEFNLFSDYDSKINHYKRILTVVGIGSLANLLIGVNNVYLAIFINDTTSINLIGLINIGIFILFTPFLISLIRKINRYKKEKQIYE